MVMLTYNVNLINCRFFLFLLMVLCALNCKTHKFIIPNKSLNNAKCKCLQLYIILMSYMER